MRHNSTDVWRGLFVYVSVCTTDRYPAITAGPIEMPFGMWGGLGRSKHILDGGPDPPRGRGSFVLGKGLSHSKVIREHEPSSAEGRLDRLRWRLACGVGWAL